MSMSLYESGCLRVLVHAEEIVQTRRGRGRITPALQPNDAERRILEGKNMIRKLWSMSLTKWEEEWAKFPRKEESQEAHC